jgi:hypothetical protein
MRAISLDQLEGIVEHIQEEYFSQGKIWLRRVHPNDTRKNYANKEEGIKAKDEAEDEVARALEGDNEQEVVIPITSLEQVTLYDLNTHFILPQTAKHECSLVELLAEGPQKPDYFVSHWWGEPVVQFLACLKQHAKDRGLIYQPGDEYYVKDVSLSRSPYYWVCAYANNQYKLESELHSNHENLAQTSFVRAMNQSRGTVVIVDHTATCFSRLWCVYEIYSSLLLSKHEKYTFDLYTAFPHRVEGLVGGVEKRAAVGITDGMIPVDFNAEAKWSRQSHFPAKRLDLGITFDCRKGRASFKLDEERIHRAIGDDHKTTLNNRVHGVIAASLLRRVLETKTNNHEEGNERKASQYLDAFEKGKVRKLSLFMGDSPADTQENIMMVLGKLDSKECKLLDLQSNAIAYLPDNFTRFGNMTHLCLSGCSRIKKLPESFGDLGCLHSLLLQFCTSLECLPDSIGNLKLLNKMSLDCCTSLTELPDSFGGLASLCHLYLTGCSGLIKLPDSFANLQELRVLHLSRCTNLAELPSDLSLSLVDLQLEYCSSLTYLPQSMANLDSLQKLSLWGCTGLRTLPDLGQESLKDVQLGGVDSSVMEGWRQGVGRKGINMTMEADR